jgi:hypothetical protein
MVLICFCWELLLSLLLLLPLPPLLLLLGGGSQAGGGGPAASGAVERVAAVAAGVSTRAVAVPCPDMATIYSYYGYQAVGSGGARRHSLSVLLVHWSFALRGARAEGGDASEGGIFAVDPRRVRPGPRPAFSAFRPAGRKRTVPRLAATRPGRALATRTHRSRDRRQAPARHPRTVNPVLLPMPEACASSCSCRR